MIGPLPQRAGHREPGTVLRLRSGCFEAPADVPDLSWPTNEAWVHWQARPSGLPWGAMLSVAVTDGELCLCFSFF